MTPSQASRAAQKTYNREMAKLPMDTMDFNKRDRDVKVGEEIYALLLEKLEEARISENTDDSDIVIIDSASIPLVPVAPQTRRIMLVTLIVSLMGAYGIASLLDFFRDEVKGEDELSRSTHLPVLAVIPEYQDNNDSKNSAGGQSRGIRHDPGTLIFQPKYQHTYYSEANKILRTNLAFAGLGQERKAVALMSASREEGKTTCNANLAIALAQNGSRVLLCDADLRKPAVHKVFGLTIRPDQGLPLLISEQRRLEDMVVNGPVPDLWLLPCGVQVPNPSELLGSIRMVRTMKLLRDRYDYLVFDVPPVLPVTDSVLLAPLLDGVGLIVRYEKSRLREVDLALRQIRSAKANLFGLVLNAVNMQRYSYGYGYGNKYYNYYEKEKRDTV
jgi:tyrosine-protein kinase Etk/Wzc